jgi:outer membrane protein assembly factor BamB
MTTIRPGAHRAETMARRTRPARTWAAILLGLLSLIPSAALGQERSAMDTLASPMPNARVCEIVLPDLAGKGQGVMLYAYHRGGRFYHGYALLARGDNRPHRIAPEPAAPFGFFHADGREFGAEEYSLLSGTYAYKRDGYMKYYTMWQDGTLVPKRLADVPPLAWDGKTLSGTVDVFVQGHEAPGAQAYFRGHIYRVTVRADDDGKGGLAGTFGAFEYSIRDRLFRPIEGSTPIQGRCAGRWREDFWNARPGSGYADGRDWPNVRGPFLNGSAVACGAPLVDDLADARLLWVSEETTPGGRGARRNPINPDPAVDFPTGKDAYGAPVVAGGKVYLFTVYADKRHLAPAVDLYQVRGAPPTFEPKAYSDLVLCAGARTGKTLWRREFPWGLSEKQQGPPSGKGGVGLTPCAYEGTVFARGCRALYALDAATGETRWTSPGFRQNFGGWSHDESPVVIGGVLLVKTAGSVLAGVDPKTGKELWRVENVTGNNAIPSRVVLDGGEYIVSALGDYGGDWATGRLTLIEPKTGEILWETDRVAKNENSLCVLGDAVFADVGPVTKSADGKKDLCRLGAFRVARQGAEPLWTAQSEAFFSGRFTTPLAHAGHVYVDSHDNNLFSCIDARTGRPVREIAEDIDGLATHTGGGNWCVATDDRVITSGLLLFGAAPKFEPLGGPWRLPYAIGYCCPIQPAVADGRLFVRLDNCLVCYDLRKAR